MPTNTSGNARQSFLVRARQPGVLARVIDSIEEAEFAQIDRRLGPADEPHTLVVSMTEQQAQVLAQRYAGQVIIEKDRPLQSFSSS